MKKDRHQQYISSDIKFDHTSKGLFKKSKYVMAIFDSYLEIAKSSSNLFQYELNSDFSKYFKKSICKVICLMSDFQIMISSLCVKAIYEQIFV